MSIAKALHDRICLLYLRLEGCPVEAQSVSGFDLEANATNSKAKARAQYDKYDLAMRMAERLYTMPPCQRLGYLETIIQLARCGHSPLVRDIRALIRKIEADEATATDIGNAVKVLISNRVHPKEPEGYVGYTNGISESDMDFPVNVS